MKALVLAALCWAAGFAATADMQGRNELFKSAATPTSALSMPVDALPAIRSRSVRLDRAQLALLGVERKVPVAQEGAAPVGDAGVVLNLFEDVRFRAVFERRLALASGYALRGQLVGEAGEAAGRWTLAIRGNAVAGTILTRRNAYVVQLGRDGRHIVSEVDRSLFPPDDPDEEWRVRLPPDPVQEFPESTLEPRQTHPPPPSVPLSEPAPTDGRVSELPRLNDDGGRWLPMGPAPILNGQVENVSPDDEVSGAIHTVLAHPTNADVLYIGAVNGGVWRTDNATAERPEWRPLTDRFASLSIGAMAMDPNDPNVVLAGIGRYSSYGRAGGDRIGLLLTKDGGATWARIELPFRTLDSRNISGVAIDGDRLVVSAGPWCCTSVYRSLDGGVSWEEGEGLPPIGAFDLVVDPTNRNRLYATLNALGVYRSDDGGGSWQDVSSHDDAVKEAFELRVCPDGEMDCEEELKGGNNNAEMAVASNGRLYLAVLVAGQARYIGFSDNQGDTWQEMDLPLTAEADGEVNGLNPRFKPGGQGSIHFSIRVDPDQANIVYVGGDRQDLFRIEDEDGRVSFTNSLGAFDFSGRLFRGDADIEPTGAVPSPQWQHLTHRNDVGAIPGGGTANSSAPHADSREMVFNAAGDLIEVDDGGIYRRTSPRDNTGDWFSLNGNLQISEMHDIAYDPLANVALGGNQDTGTPQQRTPNSSAWDSVGTADGGDVAVDASNAPEYSIRYSSFQRLLGFRRVSYNANNQLIAWEWLNMAINGISLRELNPRFNFTQAVILNAVDPRRGVLPAGSVYETTDRFDTLAEIHYFGLASAQTAAYGCSTAPNLLYIGTNNNALLVRADEAGGLEATSYPGQSPRDILIDPRDCNTVYVADVSEVYVSNDTGASWRRITGNLVDVPVSWRDLRNIEFVPATGPFGADTVLVAGRGGVHAMLPSEEGVWLSVNEGLPRAPAWDFDYEPTDNVLVVSTLGRGAWQWVQGPAVLEAIADLALEVADGDATVSLAGVFDDESGGGLFYTVTSSDETIASARIADGVVRVTPHAAGVATIRVVARDASDATTATTFVVTIGAVLNIAASASAAEGETARLSVRLSRALGESIDVDYRLAPDADAGSADADPGDYVAPAGKLTIPAGATSATIEVAINDDDRIEPTREVFVVHLTVPERNPRFGVGLASSSRVVINEGVCDRTAPLREAVVQALGVSTCAAVGSLDGLVRLDLSGRGIERFKQDDFLDMVRLRYLDLSDNAIASAPIFNPSENRPGPSRLETLLLGSNRLATLPSNAFNGLSSLRHLSLRSNQLAVLPAGIFSGLTALQSLQLQDNPGAPFKFVLELKRIDAEAWRASSPARVVARIAQGAPFEVVVSWAVAGGRLSSQATTLAAGSVASGAVSVAQLDGDAAQVTVQAPPLPATECRGEPCYQGFVIAAGEPLLLFRARPAVIATSRQLVPTLQFGGDALTLDLADFVADADSDSLQFTTEFTAPLLTTVEVEGSLLVITPGADEETFKIVVTVTDSDGYSVTFVLTVIVGPADRSLLRGWRLPWLIQNNEDE